MVRWARTACAVVVVCMGLGCDEQDEPVGQSTPDAGDAGQQPVPTDAALADAAHGQGRGDAATGSASDFAIRGRVASSSIDKQLQPSDAAVASGITHVMAVNPATANPVRYVQPVAANGSFSIGVDLHKPWVIVLVDATQTGAAMNVGVFRAADFDLDSLAATRPGMLDLGDVTIDATGTASAEVSTAGLLSALGLSEASATLLGSMDDVSLRYVNPDIDGNGMIDALEDRSYPLDFHLRYTMRQAGHDVALTELLNRFADPASSEARYGIGSAIVWWEPTRFGSTTVADFGIRFPNFAGSFSAPPLGNLVFAVNQWITGASGLYQSAGSNSVGISFDATQPFPTGTYVFKIKTTELTFTDVRTHTLMELNRSENLLIPFLSMVAPDATCTGWSCAVTGIGYRWMKRVMGSWVEATQEEVALVVPQNGGFISFVIGSGSSPKRVAYTIPGSPVTGTIALSSPLLEPGSAVTPPDLASLTVGTICNLGVSYDDTLGMRIFQGWKVNEACFTAPPPPASP